MSSFARARVACVCVACLEKEKEKSFQSKNFMNPHKHTSPGRPFLHAASMLYCTVHVLSDLADRATTARANAERVLPTRSAPHRYMSA